MDYFAFPVTDAEILEDVRRRDVIEAIRTEERNLRRKASEALKAANAKKREWEKLEKDARPYNQKRSPHIYGSDLLTPAQRLALDEHRKSGKPTTLEEAELLGMLMPRVHYFCEPCAKEKAHWIKASIKLKTPIVRCFDSCRGCGRHSDLCVAALLHLPLIPISLAEAA